jgi:hypothetical protein
MVRYTHDQLIDRREVLIMFEFNGFTIDEDNMEVEAPDGCMIEVDGECPHGHRSPVFDMV